MAEAYLNFKGKKPTAAPPNMKAMDALVDEARQQAKRTLEAYKNRYLEHRGKIMPFFQRLAERAVGKPDPISGKHTPEGTQKLEQTRVYIRQLVNNQMTTSHFLNQMQHILRQEIPQNLHARLEALMNDVRSSKDAYEAAKKNYEIGQSHAANAVNQGQIVNNNNGQYPPTMQFGQGGMNSSNTSSISGVSTNMIGSQAQQPWSSASSLDSANAAKAQQGGSGLAIGIQQRHMQAQRIAQLKKQEQEQQQHRAIGQAGYSSTTQNQQVLNPVAQAQTSQMASIRPTLDTKTPQGEVGSTNSGGGSGTVDAIIVSFKGSLTNLSDENRLTFLNQVKTKVAERINEKGATTSSLSASILPNVSIQIRIASASWHENKAYSVCLDIYHNPITIEVAGQIFTSAGAANEVKTSDQQKSQTSSASTAASTAAKKSTAKGKRKRKPDDSATSKKQNAKGPPMDVAKAANGTSVFDATATSIQKKQRTQALAGGSQRVNKYPPPSKELMELPMLLNVVALDLFLHKKVAAILGTPGENYDPRSKTRIGEDVHNTISDSVESWLLALIREIRKVNRHRLDTRWQDHLVSVDNTRKQLEIYNHWVKDVLEREKEEYMERLRKEVMKDGGKAKAAELEQLMSKEKEKDDKSRAAEQALQMFDFGSKKKKATLQFEPPLPPNTKLRALRKKKKDEDRPGCAAIVYIKKEPVEPKIKSQAKITPQVKPKLKPIGMRDITCFLESDCNHSKSLKLFQLLSKKGGR